MHEDRVKRIPPSPLCLSDAEAILKAKLAQNFRDVSVAFLTLDAKKEGYIGVDQLRQVHPTLLPALTLTSTSTADSA